MNKLALTLIGLAITITLGVVLFPGQKRPEKTSSQFSTEETEISASPEPESGTILPTAEFEKRITKKSFGIYITPENSPVQPERFTGLHTGVDVEYEDAAGEVPVLAICDGEIILAEWVGGYGGVIGLKCNLQNQTIYILHGHLEPQSFTSKTLVKKGDQIGVLGEGQTQATDFERKHLHLAISKNKLDLRGYVKTKEELNNWLNPQKFLDFLD